MDFRYATEMFLEVLLFGVAITLGLLVLIGAVSVPTHFSDREVCRVYSRDFETDFGYWQGCMVKDPKSGIWIDSSDIENINGTLDIKGIEIKD